MSKTITVRAHWESVHEIEVPDDFTDTGRLSDFPDNALEEITSDCASLVDWYVN